MKKNSTDESTIVENTVQWPRHREEVPRQDELAVIRIHKSVHLMNLYRMAQNPDEAIRAFVARVRSTADLCGMTSK